MTPWLEDPDVTLYHGDCLDVLRELPSGSVHMCATSPPFYGLRDYGTEGQIGLEETPDQWVDRLVAVFREVRRVLRDDGTLWVEIGDSYNATTRGAGGDGKQHTNAGSVLEDRSWRVADGCKPKDLLGQPWLLAFALRADGWYLRSEIIWARPNPMPESVTDRPTKSHSTIFLLSKKPRYYFDADAIRSPHQHDGRKVDHVKGTDASHQHRDGPRWPDNGGANARSVWQIATEPTPFAHFATWPRKLVARMIQAGTSERGCCPECGAPWVREVERGESDYARLKREQGHEWTDMDAAALERGTITQPGEGGQTRNANGTVPSLKPRASETVGWRPSCNCGDVSEVQHHDVDEEPIRGAVPVLRPHLEPVPAVVLDPFAGSGTTNLVARNHGRRSIGIELNAEYLKIAADRLSQLSLVNDEMFA